MRMLSANSRLSLAVLLTVLCHAQVVELSLHTNKSVDGLDDETRCNWNCTDMDSDFSEETKTAIAEKKMIRLVVKYEKRVNEKCVNQTSRNSSGNVTEHWQIWLANKQLSLFAKALESVINMMLCPNSTGEQKEIMAICTLRPVNATAAKPTHYKVASPIFFPSLRDLGVKLDSIDCNTQTTDNSQPCINITKSTGDNSSNSEGLLKCNGWPADVLLCLCVVFMAVFVYYSPAFVCLFSPTEVTEDGVHQIVLDGASPVSPRCLMGNYFFSNEDTIWHKARMFILQAVVFPFPFLGPAIFAEYLQQSKFLTMNYLGVSHLLQSRMIVSYVCYYIIAFYTSFSPPWSSRGNRPCIVCRRVKSKTLICQENLPKTITNHLRIQPQIIVHCWRLFIRLLLNYFKTCFLLIPSVFEVSAKFFRRWFLFIVLLSTSPAMTILLLILMLLVVLFAIILTSPIMVFCGITRQVNAHFHNHRLIRLFICFVLAAVAILAQLGSVRLLMFAGFGILIAFLSAFVLLLSEESLPLIACFVLVLYYIWSSYSSFTNKYQDLGLALFKHYKSYKKSRRHSQVTDMTINTDSLLKNTQNAVGNKDNVMKIPRELFHMACEELMPIRESVCVLILKVALTVSFVFLVFSLTILLNVDATPVMRTLIAFLTGSFPKIVAMYMDGRRQKKIKAIIAEEKIPQIVQEYIEGASAAHHDQRQLNSGSDVDV
ncbi:uncharacterized protein LOC110041051 [Orbicella faveolata]|uniref:uncharacterized protein LOC110041051 n=1 Tax=Orbicella faveolata TaxID=48498 RepID=UPI0009E1CAA9|nr:uncharacterized protein LOC110041051 [Orbicella faveolata]